MIYFLLIQILFFYSLLIYYNNNKIVILQTSYDFLIISSIVLLLTIFASIRYDVGRDYLSYLNILTKKTYLASRGTRGSFEKGFILLYKFIDQNQFNPILIFVFFSFNTYLLIILSLYRFRKYFPFSIFLFVSDGVLFASFNGLRQYLAISLFLFSIIYISKKQIFSYMCFIALGFLFHKSILLLIPFYFLLNITISKRIIMVMLIFSWVVSNFIPYLPIDLLFSASSTYAGYSQLFLDTFKPDLSYVMLYKIFLLLLYIFDKNSIVNSKINPFLNMYIFYLCITLMFSNSWVISRFSEYLKISSLIIIPWIITNHKQKLLLIITTVFFFLVFTVNTLVISGLSEKLVYKTIFQQ